MLLPFAYLFAESSGFFGHRKGIISRAYETFTVFSLLAVVVLGITYIVSAIIYPEKRGLRTLLSMNTTFVGWRMKFNCNSFSLATDLGSCHLPFLYSCVSFLGVLLLLGKHHVKIAQYWKTKISFVRHSCSLHTIGNRSIVWRHRPGSRQTSIDAWCRWEISCILSGGGERQA